MNRTSCVHTAEDPSECACWVTGTRALREDHRVLPTIGDCVAAERPDRAGPTASDVLPAPRSAPTARAAVTRPGGRTAPLETLPARERPPRPPLAVEPVSEPQGCLYALSQPPLMLFLLVIGSLLGLGATYDLLFL